MYIFFFVLVVPISIILHSNNKKMLIRHTENESLIIYFLKNAQLDLSLAVSFKPTWFVFVAVIFFSSFNESEK